MSGGRTAIVAALVGGAIAIVLLGWYRAGMREVDGQVAAAIAAQRSAAHDAEVAAAAAVTARLEALRIAESARPYLHYQNLFHDPAGASEGLAVTPSPLAPGPADALVALHFQIDEGGAVSSPSINDELPETVQSIAPDRPALAGVLAVKDELTAVAARGAVRVAAEPVQVAVAPTRRQVANAALGNQAGDVQMQMPMQEPSVQTIELPPEAYAQNQMTNQIFAQTRRAPATKAPPPVPDVPPPPRAPRAPRKVTPAPPVVITVAPLVWTSTTIAGARALVAVRQVITPDGARTQGLVVQREQVAAWLAAQAPTRPADRVASPPTLVDAGGTPLGLVGAPWSVQIDVDAALANLGDVAALRRGDFLIKFVPVAVMAVLCGLLVVGVTARSERLAQERARFAAAAAHELRTPLAGIQLYGDMLADELGDPAKHKDYAHRISVEAARLGRVVANVMGVSQLERGALAVRPELGDAVAAVADAIERARPGLERAGATVELVAPAAATARLDRDAVARIVGNLLDNAEKYARGAADRTITVTVAEVDGAVEIAVRDRGPGLPAALRRGRFQAFRRAAGDDAPPGLGLGLALSSALAAAMGGGLIPRTVSPGAELVLRLPAA
ncbi:MAG: HAMP domain-containing histidine kinase [Myxococcales bacterium]|nr:HAMP domain-containing histidine kinase [Myxococcales bacterium]